MSEINFLIIKVVFLKVRKNLPENSDNMSVKKLQILYLKLQSVISYSVIGDLIYYYRTFIRLLAPVFISLYKMQHRKRIEVIIIQSHTNLFEYY